MRKAIMALIATTMLAGASSAAAAQPTWTMLPATGTLRAHHGVQFHTDYTKQQAFARAAQVATDSFAGAVMGQVFETKTCYGPYDYRHDWTQWDCHGIGVDAIHETYWRIKLDAYGKVMYKQASFSYI